MEHGARNRITEAEFDLPLDEPVLCGDLEQTTLAPPYIARSDRMLERKHSVLLTLEAVGHDINVTQNIPKGQGLSGKIPRLARRSRNSVLGMTLPQ